MILVVVLLGSMAFSCKQSGNEDPTDVVLTDTVKEPEPSQVDIFYSHGGRKMYVADFDTAVMAKFGGNEMQAIAWRGPMKVSKREQVYYLTGIADVVNFDVDPECSSKLFRFEIPLDSAIPYLEPNSYGNGFFFSWGTIFDTTQKRFVAEEIWQRGQHDKIVAELKGFNLHYQPKGIDSLQIMYFHTRDVFDEEFEIEAWVVNNSRNTVDNVIIDMTLTEYTAHMGGEALDSVKYKDLDILQGPIEGRTFQVVRKNFKNKKYKPSAEYSIGYYNTKQTFKNYTTNGETVDVNKAFP